MAKRGRPPRMVEAPQSPVQVLEPPIRTSVISDRVNRLEETKLDAEFNFKERVRQDEARKAHEKAKMEILQQHRATLGQ